MYNKKIVIAGGTGFIGNALIERWGAHNTIVVLTRQAKAGNANVMYVQWNGRTTGPWAQALEGADLLVNLAGKSVNCRYTAANKAAIFASREQTTAALGEAVQSLAKPPALWINAASATIYRHAEDRPMDELTGEYHNDFSVQVCKRWESTFNGITLPHTRKVVLRIAITLGSGGGVMAPYLNLVKFGLGGRQGSGRQMFSWVHIDDVAGMMEWLTEHPECSGTYNCAAPNPVPNKVFMATLRKAAGCRFGLPAFSWMLEAGAALIGTETELLLKSRWVVPARIMEAGFVFRHPRLTGAMEQIVAALPRRRYRLL